MYGFTCSRESFQAWYLCMTNTLKRLQNSIKILTIVKFAYIYKLVINFK